MQMSDVMKRFILLSISAFLLPHIGSGQERLLADNISISEEIRFAPPQKDRAGFDEKVYKLKLTVDIPVTAVGGGWSYYMLSKVYDKDTIPVSTVAALNKDDINGLDRWAAGKYDPDMDRASDYLFYGSMPLPALSSQA